MRSEPERDGGFRATHHAKKPEDAPVIRVTWLASLGPIGLRAPDEDASAGRCSLFVFILWMGRIASCVSLRDWGVFA